MNKKILFFWIFILSFILLFNIISVCALGVTPARNTLDFEPGLKKDLSFSIINSEHKDMNIIIYAEGELAKSIILQGDSSFKMSASEESREIKYSLKIPNELRPGVRIGEIVILETPVKTSNDQNYIGATVAVVTQIYVYVPYPGKYAEAELNVVNAEQGGEAVFVIPIVNRGDLGLENIRVNIDIYNKLNEKITTINSETISIISGEKKDIVVKWKADSPVGTYRAVATVIYDGETISLEKQFNIGTADLDLQEITVNDFSLGQIAKMEMLVENKWSEPITGAYAQTNIFNAKGEVMVDFKSATQDFSPLSKEVLTSYWDTGGVGEGTYEASVYLRYGEKSSQKDLQLKVSEDNLEIIGLGYVISSGRSSSSDGNSGLIFILIVVVVVLILVNLLWFLVLRKKPKK